MCYNIYKVLNMKNGGVKTYEKIKEEIETKAID